VLRDIWKKNWPEIQAALTGGIPEFVRSRNPRDLGNTIPVFVYHVADALSFAADLQFLADNRYVTIDADTLLDHLEKRKLAPERSVVLTFDDGARNLYEVAYPLLHKYKMRAVAFLATQFHREDSEFPSSQPDDMQYPLSWGQIREMHHSGRLDFQSHTHEHRYVPCWPESKDLEGSSPEFTRGLLGPALSLDEDFRTAKRILEDKLGKTIRHLAFPVWDGTEEAVEIGSKAGYRTFWWGVLPRRPANYPGSSPHYIVRLDRRYVRRLPGHCRRSMLDIFAERYGRSFIRYWNRVRALVVSDRAM
jgi:peptidoglycan/xylan/chitin deacetylase (PgdA/CDA1 family)